MTLTLTLIAPWLALLGIILWDTREKRDDLASLTAEKRAFLRRHDGLDVVNLIVLALTFSAAAVAAYEGARLADLTDQLVRDGQASSTQQAEFTRESNRLNREALIASSRAWVGPVDAKLASPLEVGKANRIVISVRNTGKEPARNFHWLPGHSIGDNGDALSQKIDTDLRFCFGVPSIPFGQVIFPSSGFGSGADFTIELPKEEVDEDVVSGRKFIVTHGCIAYETSGSVRHSAFCYFYKSGVSPPDHLNICDGGSSAD